MAGDKSYKRVQLPEGLERAEIVHKTKDHPIREEAYDKVLEADFDAHRAEYREVIMYGVAVKVKVKKVSKGS
jgi:hypothetical protein